MNQSLSIQTKMLMYCTPGGVLTTSGLFCFFFVHNLSLICLQLDEMSCISVQLAQLRIINFCDLNCKVVALLLNFTCAD